METRKKELKIQLLIEKCFTWQIFNQGNFYYCLWASQCNSCLKSLQSLTQQWIPCSSGSYNSQVGAISQEFLIHRNVCHQLKPNQNSHSRLWIRIKGNLEHNIKRECKKEKERKRENKEAAVIIYEKLKEFEWYMFHIFTQFHWMFTSCWNKRHFTHRNLLEYIYINIYQHIFICLYPHMGLAEDFCEISPGSPSKKNPSTAKHLHLLLQIQTPRRA